MQNLLMPLRKSDHSVVAVYFFCASSTTCRCNRGRKLFAVVHRERKFNRRTKLRRWNSVTVGAGFQSRRWLSPSPIILARRVATLSIFAAVREIVRRTLIWINFRRKVLPRLSTSSPSPLSPPPPLLNGLIHPLSYSVTLSFSRRWCCKSRVHFPHFSPSWRAARAAKGWDAKKKLRGKRAGEGVKRGKRESARPKNFTFRGCETSPLRCNGPQAAVGASDILPRYFALIPGITSLVSTDLIFEQLREQIALFCGINPGSRNNHGVENYYAMCIEINVSCGGFVMIFSSITETVYRLSKL